MKLIKIIFTWAPYAAFLVAYFGYVRRSGFSRTTRRFWTVFLLICASKFLCFDLIGGHTFTPELPEKLVWAWNLAYSGSVFLAMLTVLTWSWRNVRLKRVLLPLAAWSLAGWGLWNGISPPAVHEYVLEFEQLPPALDGYRIVQISDTHASCAARAWRTRRIVETANALKPDLICLTGDYVDGKVTYAAPFLAPLVDLRAKDGVYAVTGNHEYYLDAHNWKRYWHWSGIRFLHNRCVFPRPQLALGGVNDVRAYGRGYDDMPVNPNVSRAFASATNGEFRVLLQHQPSGARANVTKRKVDLQLSGHTHGGILPVFSWLVARSNEDFLRGIYKIGRSRLFVTTGSGQWAGFPIRYFTPSEIALLTLKRAEKR